MFHHRIKVIGLLVLSVFMVTGCSEGSEGAKTPLVETALPAPTPTMVAAETDLLTLENGTEIYFPKAAGKCTGIREVMEALLIGKLELHDKCLYAANPSSEWRILLIWPACFEIREENKQIVVYNRTGEEVAIVGKLVVMGGGEVSRLSEEMLATLPKECRESPYWIVGEVDKLSDFTYSLNAYPQNSSLTENVLLSDAMNYATDYNLSVEEALKQLALQKSFVILNEQLLDNEPTFAGAYIQHAPEYRFIARFTGNFQGDIQTYLPDDSLSQYIEVDTSAQYPIIMLQLVQDTMKEKINDCDIKVESSIRVSTNRIELYVADIDDFNATVNECRYHLGSFLNREEIDIIEVGVLSEE
ncbi:MAG: hypothetical protein DRI56_06190 [Chloroflexota bacterium]|nr:MAG: hypothetical protein DRI56_06190 [Chloroflexota bacterium]